MTFPLLCSNINIDASKCLLGLTSNGISAKRGKTETSMVHLINNIINNNERLSILIQVIQHLHI